MRSRNGGAGVSTEYCSQHALPIVAYSHDTRTLVSMAHYCRHHFPLVPPPSIFYPSFFLKENRGIDGIACSMGSPLRRETSCQVRCRLSWWGWRGRLISKYVSRSDRFWRSHPPPLYTSSHTPVQLCCTTL